ncbi:hypothetical_protein [Leishmania braziliensis MHOM/BR/75/M2904]|uniref:Hypothetical_protein n=1 Tax=Leishmania braziliensis MHOM/BR/75/M2904 TaxID=420245 RepID=A0A3P3ZEZ7_LEIBR|nr:hypothetical_protein [Leishmania braziliensis MHOM/BR/75/M2904]
MSRRRSASCTALKDAGATGWLCGDSDPVRCDGVLLRGDAALEEDMVNAGDLDVSRGSPQDGESIVYEKNELWNDSSEGTWGRFAGSCTSSRMGCSPRCASWSSALDSDAPPKMCIGEATAGNGGTRVTELVCEPQLCGENDAGDTKTVESSSS